MHSLQILQWTYSSANKIADFITGKKFKAITNDKLLQHKHKQVLFRIYYKLLKNYA